MQSFYEINGTLIWYYYICKREVWYIAHGIEADQSSDFLVLGRHIHEIFYKDRKKELMIDNNVKIDILPEGKVIGEIKKSSKYLKSAIMQLSFYLYYMKKVKGAELKGVLLIPEERKRIEVELDSEKERELEDAIEGIKRILSMDKPPKPVKIPYCSKCAYKEFCWA